MPGVDAKGNYAVRTKFPIPMRGNESLLGSDMPARCSACFRSP